MFLYFRADYDSMEDFLDLSIVYHLASDNKFNVEQAWTSLKQILVSGCNQFIPKLKISSKPKPKWFNQHIRHFLNCARTLRRLAVKHPSASNKAKLTASENHLQSAIQDTKDEYIYVQ